MGRLVWHPILEAELAERAWQAVEHIAGDLRRFAGETRPPSLPPSWSRQPGGELSLANGWAGIALFFAYLDQARPGRGHDDTALELLERAVAGIGGQTVPPGLYAGFAGVAWAMEHLTGWLLENEPGEDPGEEAAAAMARFLGQSPWTGAYDVISGLAGFGVYALERWPQAPARECLARAVARLAETAEPRPVGIAWRTPPDRLEPDEIRDRYPQGCFNLGIAHGVPGVIAMLAGACAAGITEARPLACEAMAWLSTQKRPPGAGSVFPTEAAPVPAGTPEPSGLAWCYGDLGIAAALLAAARGLGEAGWEREALELARAAAARPPADEDAGYAGLCHGAAGNGHLFNRLYQATGDPVFAEAARSWLLCALDKTRPGVPFGFQTLALGTQGEMGWQDEPGFLTGAAGIGLALLAAAAPVEPAWDRVLLVSAPRFD